MSRLLIAYLSGIILLLVLGGCDVHEKEGAQPEEARKLPRSLSDTASSTGDTTSGNFRSPHTHSVPLGDVDGNNRPDTATVICPRVDDGMECEGGCITRISFSSPSIPALIDSMSIGGIVADAGDADGNGTDDILFLPDWPTSCWIGMTLYGLRDNEWKVLAGGSYYRCNEDPYNQDSLAQRIRHIEPGVFELMQDTLDEGEGGIVRAAVRFDLRSGLPATQTDHSD